MAKSRQIILTGTALNGEGAGPLGTKREAMRTLARYNTAPDGSPNGFGIAHGPGLRVEFPMVDDRDDVNQVMVTVLEEEIAWPVLERICRQEKWRMVDPETGRVFGG